MKGKSLTLIMNNIPEDRFKIVWDYAAKLAKNSLNVEIKSTDFVEIDFEELFSNARTILLDVMSDIISLYIVQKQHEESKTMN